MRVTHEDIDHLTILTLHGDFTADDVEPFQHTVLERVKGKVRDVVLDLHETEFIDSRGLETLLWLRDRCVQEMGQMRLCASHPNVETILHVTRLAPQFERHADVDSAVKSLRL